jgi:AcrR family transcriptional regulator
VYNAVLTEFLRVPLEEVQVKKIVEECNIPRGSFYSYFESKEGALAYVINETRNKKKDRLQLDQTKDKTIVEMIKHVFDRELNFAFNQESSVKQLFEQIILSEKAIKIFKTEMVEGLIGDQDMTESWNRQGLEDVSEVDKRVIAKLFLNVLFDSIVSIYDQSISRETLEHEFNLKMNIIGAGLNGVYK